VNRCVCNGLGAYMDQVDTFPGYLVHECDDHPLPRNDMEETVTDAAARRVDECLDAIATIRDVLWPASNPDAEWNAETVESVARALDFLRPVTANSPSCDHCAERSVDLEPGGCSLGDPCQLCIQCRADALNGARELRTTRLRIEGLRAIEGEASMLGTVYILGVLHHAWFVRVEEQDGDQVAVDDPHGRLEDFQQLDADRGSMQTVNVPGYPGEYIVVIYPAGQ
jgi:hypothetical protein